MIYFLEDDDNIRKLVCYALSKEGYEIEGFSKPQDFHSAMDKNIPDLVLLDIMLPGEDGMNILAEMRQNQASKDIPVIMLTARGSEYDKVAALDAGADDYVTKPFGMTELASRVRAVLRRTRRQSDDSSFVYTAGSLRLNPSRHTVDIAGTPIQLSYKEYSLLLILMEAGGSVVTRNELLRRVWGEYYDESRTLDVHIRKLRVKLEAAGDIIRTVKSVGYRIGGTDE